MAQFILVSTKIVAKEEQYTYQSGDMEIVFRAGKKPWTWIIDAKKGSEKYAAPLIEEFVRVGIVGGSIDVLVLN